MQWELPAGCPVELGVLIGGGVFIIEIDPEGVGYKAGLRVSNSLLSINGERCTEATQAASMLKAAEGVLTLEVVQQHIKGRRASRGHSSPLPFLSRLRSSRRSSKEVWAVGTVG